MLRAEILDLEDQYYRLKSQCESAGILADGGVIYDRALPADVMMDSSTEAAPGQRRPARSRPVRPSNESDLSIELGEPQIDDGTPISDGTQPNLENPQPNQLPPPGGDNSSVPQGGNNLKLMGYNAPLTERADRFQSGAETQVAEIVIHESSAAQDVDTLPGDDGLELLIQPRRADGSVVEQDGLLTVSIVDEAVEPRRRIGQWQFDPSELACFFVRSEYPDRGILLHLPWDEAIPESGVLTVAVRLVTRDHRVVEDVKRITMAPPPQGYSPQAEPIAAWLAVDDRWATAGVQTWRPNR
jgi:hypothetical protein